MSGCVRFELSEKTEKDVQAIAQEFKRFNDNVEAVRKALIPEKEK